MMLLSEFWRTGDSPWLRRTRGEISWKITGSVRTVKLLKITLHVLFIWVNYLISSPSMVFRFHRLGFAFCHTNDPCLHLFTRTSERNQWEGSAEGKLRHKGLQRSDSRGCRITIRYPFNTDSLSTLVYSKPGNFFKVCWFILSLLFFSWGSDINFLRITKEQVRYI